MTKIFIFLFVGYLFALSKVLSGTFNGTVDDACMSHFSNVITLDPNAVNANKAAIMHNQHVKEAKAVVGVLAIVGAGVAAYNNR